MDEYSLKSLLLSKPAHLRLPQHGLPWQLYCYPNWATRKPITTTTKKPAVKHNRNYKRWLPKQRCLVSTPNGHVFCQQRGLVITGFSFLSTETFKCKSQLATTVNKLNIYWWHNKLQNAFWCQRHSEFYITWLLYKTSTAMQSAVLIPDKQLPTRKQE